MCSEQTRDRADRARRIYDQRLRTTLEAEHAGRFVAVEPDSGDHFLADTLDAAADAAQAAHPARRSHVLRVGHPAALHIGGGGAVTGRVDAAGRALVRVSVAATARGPRTDVEAWVDTAFTGGLTLPRVLATGLGLTPGVSSDAVLADGSQVALESFVCFLDWFGRTYRTQAVATDAVYPLLGTQLLAGRRLVVDYAAGTVELT